MSRLQRIKAWAIRRLRDLFYGPGNFYLDLARIIVASFAGLMALGTLWNIHMGKELDLGPSGLGGGLAALLTAAAALIAAKDHWSAKAAATIKDASDA